MINLRRCNHAILISFFASQASGFIPWGPEGTPLGGRILGDRPQFHRAAVEGDSNECPPKQVIVVGGGVGGLAIASRLAAQSEQHGTKVQITILEKNQDVGGRCGSFERNVEGFGSFRHERGPSLLLLPDVYKDVFSDCSEESAEDFGLLMKQCTPAYQVVFEDGDAINVGFPRQPSEPASPEEEESRAKMDQYETGGSQKWDDYLRATSAYLDAGLPNFIEERLDLLSLPNFLIEALRDYAKAWPLKPHSDVLDAIFESDKMKALASFQDLYVGLEPYRNNKLLGGGVLKSTAPAVFGLLAAIELHPSNKKSGVFAPVGGFQKVAEALEQLATKKGIQVQCGTMVTSVQSDGVFIQSDEDEVNSPPTFLPSDLTIINADLPYATKSLLETKSSPSEAIFDWDDQFTFSSGVIAFHWSIDKVLEDLNTHNVFLMGGSRSQAEASWQILRENQGETLSPQTPFNFYVHRPTGTDPTAAPAGCDSIMVLVPCRTLQRDAEAKMLSREKALELYQAQFPPEVIDQARRAVLERLGAVESLQDLESHIVDEVVDTPATWADQFHLGAGTPFALSHGFAQLSLTRPGHKYASSSATKTVSQDRILFCGASTRPGNGVPLVLMGAKQVANKAIRQLERQVLKETNS